MLFRSLGYVSAQRGRGGGLTLAREPDAVIVGTVVREFENLEGLVECMDPATSTCPVCGGCGLQGALGWALAAFLTHPDGYRLTDLVPQPGRFRDLRPEERWVGKECDSQCRSRWLGCPKTQK